MDSEKQRLVIEQLDIRLKAIQSVVNSFNVPSEGWINTIRKSLNMSLKQLAKRLKITPQSVKKLELHEKDGTISIGKITEVAEALGCRFVYGFIPVEGSLEKMIEKRAEELAMEIVLRTSHTMKLEDQENSRERISKAIKSRAEKIKFEMPKYLWD
ncbi:MAG TPA: mobile mystery protein A [Ignavibacteriales bacterium]|nr:mobile mystery protein A [Ignavibacteriales bacterium]